MAAVWEELKRRNVVRVAIAFSVVSWLILQLTDVLIPLLGLPEWVGKLVFFLLAIGFPLALVFAWAYELTPEGLKREHTADRSQSTTSQTGRRLDFLIIGVLVVAVGMLLVDKFQPSEPSITPDPVAEELSDPEETVPSIAVLPFVNLSADEDSAYFSDGLADTILHMLAQIRELRVAARTSSFQFRGQSLDVAKIGEQLNVGTILEGSVQRSGDKIRVTAQLIDVSNGYHLWSGNFDRELEDVFAIQDEIATAVVSALKVSLLGESAQELNRGQTDDIDAYTEYLLAINDLNIHTSESIASAIRHLQEAVRLDPDYALAHAMLSHAYVENTRYGYMRLAEGLPAARVAANHALDIFPESSLALAVLGVAELQDRNLDTAGQLLSKAVDVGPNDTLALTAYARYLLIDGRLAEGVVTFRQILRLDPFSESALFGLAYSLRTQRNFSEASETVTSWKNVSPMSSLARWAEAWIEYRQGNFAAASSSITDAYLLDKKDPEGPFLIGLIYLEMDMPTDARQWFDRAVEIDAQHPVSLVAPIVLNYYLQQNDDENVRLARENLTDGTEQRMHSRGFALRALRERAARTGRYDSMLEVLEILYPNLFDDPPPDVRGPFKGNFYGGIALMRSGDVERGIRLLQLLKELPPVREKYNVVTIWDIAVRLLIGDTDGALDMLEEHSRSKYTGYLDKFELEHNSIFDPIRNEPAFITLLDQYRENAAKQRQILQAMNKDSSGQ